jgi:DNA-binding transcriptional MerR regulator
MSSGKLCHEGALTVAGNTRRGSSGGRRAAGQTKSASRPSKPGKPGKQSASSRSASKSARKATGKAKAPRKRASVRAGKQGAQSRKKAVAKRSTSSTRATAKQATVAAAGSSKARPSAINAKAVTERTMATPPSDGKLYYRIGEVAKITGVKPHVLRYWETEFRWMTPPKSRSKQRLYRRKDIDMILAIKRLLYEERYTIAGARQRIRELGVAGEIEAAAQQSSRVPAADDAMALLGQFCSLREELQDIRQAL